MRMWTPPNALRTLPAMLSASALTVAGCAAAEPDPRSLLASTQRSDYPSAFAFRDIPDAAGLQSCTGAGRTIVGWVDADRSTAAFRYDPDGPAILIWTPTAVYLRAETVTDDAPVDWLKITDTTSLEQRDALSDVLDPTLDGYASASTPPSNPSELAISAAQAARTVTSSTDPDGTQVVTALIDDDTLDTPSPAGNSASGALELHFSFDDLNRIDTVAAHEQRQAPDDSFGFTLEYDWTATPREITLPSLAQVGDLATIDPQTLRSPPTSDCSLGL